jgi:hypothetical protein
MFQQMIRKLWQPVETWVQPEQLLSGQYIREPGDSDGGSDGEGGVGEGEGGGGVGDGGSGGGGGGEGGGDVWGDGNGGRDGGGRTRPPLHSQHMVFEEKSMSS